MSVLKRTFVYGLMSLVAGGAKSQISRIKSKVSTQHQAGHYIEESNNRAVIPRPDKNIS